MTKLVKVAKKVDVKREAKNELSLRLAEFLRNEGYEVDQEAADYAFTGGTLVVGTEKTDVQVKFITPKSGLERYQKVEYVDELPEA